MSAVGTINVKPEELIVKSVELRQKIAVLKKLIEALNSQVEKTGNYWLGEAGYFHREMYIQSVKEEPELIKSLEEYANVLNQIAANYMDKEGKLVELAGALPNDILS